MSQAERDNELPHYGTMHLGTEGGESLQIPILDTTGHSGELQQVFHKASEPMRRIGAAYRGQGLEPELSTAYISAELDDGRYLVLPVNYLAIPSSSGRGTRADK
jgi:hypothetical protein